MTNESMQLAKREALETSGFRFGDAEDFLGLSIEERQTVQSRLADSRTRRASQSEIGDGLEHGPDFQLASELDSPAKPNEQSPTRSDEQALSPD